MARIASRLGAPVRAMKRPGCLTLKYSILAPLDLGDGGYPAVHCDDATISRSPSLLRRRGRRPVAFARSQCTTPRWLEDAIKVSFGRIVAPIDGLAHGRNDVEDEAAAKTASPGFDHAGLALDTSNSVTPCTTTGTSLLPKPGRLAGGTRPLAGDTHPQVRRK